MKDIKLPLKVIEGNIIADFEGKQLAKTLIETNEHEMCEYFVEAINQSTILLLENEDLKNKIQKLTDIINKMQVVVASSEELVEMLQKQNNGDQEDYNKR